MNGIYGGRKFQSGEGIIPLFVFGPDKTGYRELKGVLVFAAKKSVQKNL